MRIHSLLVAALIGLSPLFFSRCGGSTTPPPPPPAVTVSVSPGTANVAAGATVQFSVSVGNTTNHSVTWEVNEVAGGNSEAGTVSDSGLYTAPAMTFSPLTATVTAVSEADPAKSSSAQVNVLAAHRIGVRVVGGFGEFYDRMTGITFTPRGNNYTRLATQQDAFGQTTFYHSTFNVGLYDSSRSEATLGHMQASGYNVVRVFLNGCCEGGIGNPAGGLSSSYLANLTDFLARAKAHHIFVILTDDGVPLLGGYADLINPYCCSTFANYNADYLSPGGLEAEKRYANDLVQGLIDQRALLDAILAFELRNELYFVSDQPPLSLSSGLVTTANGRTYDMTDPAAKQRMMDDNLIYWTDQAHGVIMGLDPSAPVTVGFFASEGPNPVIQPYPAMANSTADFVDLHTYPRIDFSLAQYVEHFGFGGYLAKPVIMGEFGAFKSVYGNSQDAAVGLRAWQVDSCQYMFKGWLLWTWDTDEQPELWNGLSETGLINAALAPAARPDPCVN